MRSTAKADLSEFAEQIISRTAAIEAKAKKALETLYADESLNEETVTERRREILDTYRTDMKDLRVAFSGRVQRRLDELHQLGERIAAPAASSPATVATLQLLQMADAVTPEMLKTAAVQIGDDTQAQIVLQQIADRNGYGHAIRGMMKVPDRHLTALDLDNIASDIGGSFGRYFDCREYHADDDSVIYDHPDADRHLNAAERIQTGLEMSDIQRGKPFTFDSNAIVQTEYNALESGTEL